MKKKTFYLTSDFDQLELHVMVMEPEGEPRGILQICHGMAEHKERYLPFMEELCKWGYVAVIHDHRGHGKSIKRKNELGFFYDETGEAIVEDAHQISLWASPSENKMTAAAIELARAACKVRGNRPGRLFQRLAFAAYGKQLEEGESPNGWISYNKENVKAYDEDPLDGFMFTNNGFLNLFLLMKRTYDKKGWNVKHPSLPILFIAGADAPCIGSKKQYGEAIAFLRKRGYTQIRGVLFRHRRHEILNEDHVEKVYQIISEFLESAEE